LQWCGTSWQSTGLAIRIIITGGTFDKHYDELNGELTFKDSHLPEILRYVRATVPIELEINQLIDSLDMRMSNRMRILESCTRAPEEGIIIIHGTDTMTDTAKLLGEAGLEKRIVLTGSMVPYAVTNSDAVFNLGCSVSAVQLVEPGVWVVMNGRVFRWDKVRKNKSKGVFEEVNAE
jgi:L-asparaginase